LPLKIIYTVYIDAKKNMKSIGGVKLKKIFFLGFVASALIKKTKHNSMR
jgi:hypothetical protein